MGRRSPSHSQEWISLSQRPEPDPLTWGAIQYTLKMSRKSSRKTSRKMSCKNLSKSCNKKFKKSVVDTYLLFKLDFCDDLCGNFGDIFKCIELYPRPLPEVWQNWLRQWRTGDRQVLIKQATLSSCLSKIQYKPFIGKPFVSEQNYPIYKPRLLNIERRLYHQAKKCSEMTWSWIYLDGF